MIEHHHRVVLDALDQQAKPLLARRSACSARFRRCGPSCAAAADTEWHQPPRPGLASPAEELQHAPPHRRPAPARRAPRQCLRGARTGRAARSSDFISSTHTAACVSHACRAGPGRARRSSTRCERERLERIGVGGPRSSKWGEDSRSRVHAWPSAKPVSSQIRRKASMSAASSVSAAAMPMASSCASEACTLEFARALCHVSGGNVDHAVRGMPAHCRAACVPSHRGSEPAARGRPALVSLQPTRAQRRVPPGGRARQRSRAAPFVQASSSNPSSCLSAGFRPSPPPSNPRIAGKSRRQIPEPRSRCARLAPAICSSLMFPIPVPACPTSCPHPLA